MLTKYLTYMREAAQAAFAPRPLTALPTPLLESIAALQDALDDDEFGYYLVVNDGGIPLPQIEEVRAAVARELATRADRAPAVAPRELSDEEIARAMAYYSRHECHSLTELLELQQLAKRRPYTLLCATPEAIVDRAIALLPADAAETEKLLQLRIIAAALPAYGDEEEHLSHLDPETRRLYNEAMAPEKWENVDERLAHMHRVAHIIDTAYELEIPTYRTMHLGYAIQSLTAL